MATFVDASEGWAIFRQSGGRVSREVLNEALLDRGFDPIALRTYGHYEKLLRLGYAEYVPINRLDVRHANDSIFDSADRARYQERTLSDPGRLVVPGPNSVRDVVGTVVAISEGYATLRVDASEENRALGRAKKYNKGVLQFDRVDVGRAVEVRDANETGGRVDLQLEFRNLLETELVLPQSEILSETVIVRLDLGEDASFYRMLAVVRSTFDLFESLRGLLDHSPWEEQPLGSSVPALRVQRLEFQNPLEQWLYVAAPIAAGAGYVVIRILDIVERISDLAEKWRQNPGAARDEERKAAADLADLRARQLGNIKSQIELVELLGVMGADPDAPMGKEQQAMLEAMKDQTVEAAADLILDSNQSLTISSEGEGKKFEDEASAED